MTAMRGYHDLGGTDSEPFEIHEHDLTQWEREIDAIRVLLADDQRRLLNGEEVRRVITSMGAESYNGLSYYERWLHGFTTILVERGTLTRAEIDAAIRRAAADGTGAAPGNGGHGQHDHTHHDHDHSPDHEDAEPFRPENRRLAEG
jgi:hypothetical protein